MDVPLETGFLPTVERLINSYGVGTSLLCAICYFVYLTYSKMHSDHQCKELVDTLLKRVKDLENQVGDLTKKLEEENKMKSWYELNQSANNAYAEWIDEENSMDDRVMWKSEVDDIDRMMKNLLKDLKKQFPYHVEL